MTFTQDEGCACAGQSRRTTRQGVGEAPGRVDRCLKRTPASFSGLGFPGLMMQFSAARASFALSLTYGVGARCAMERSVHRRRGWRWRTASFCDASNRGHGHCRWCPPRLELFRLRPPFTHSSAEETGDHCARGRSFHLPSRSRPVAGEDGERVSCVSPRPLHLQFDIPAGPGRYKSEFCAKI